MILSWAAALILACSSGGPKSNAVDEADQADVSAPSAKPASATPASAPSAKPASTTSVPLIAIDVYRSAHFDSDAVPTAYGDQIRAFWRDRSEGRKERKNAIEATLSSGEEIAFANISAITYSDDRNEPKSYITIDLVDATDVETRMVFRPSPTGSFADPDGLIAAWQSYFAASRELLRSGELSGQRFDCPAWHCLGDYSHPKLAKLIASVVAGAEANKAALRRLLLEHRNPSTRAAAAFTFAHIERGDEVVELMLKAMSDPNSLVRNNVMRVLTDIAFASPKIPIPAGPLIRAIDWPTTTDRNKALAVLAGLLERPTNAANIELIRSDPVAVSRLLGLLELQQPNNHDFAFIILKKISGKNYGERDYIAWRDWAASNAKQNGKASR